MSFTLGYATFGLLICASEEQECKARVWRDDMLLVVPKLCFYVYCALATYLTTIVEKQIIRRNDIILLVLFFSDYGLL